MSLCRYTQRLADFVFAADNSRLGRRKQDFEIEFNKTKQLCTTLLLRRLKVSLLSYDLGGFPGDGQEFCPCFTNSDQNRPAVCRRDYFQGWHGTRFGKGHEPNPGRFQPLIHKRRGATSVQKTSPPRPGLCGALTLSPGRFSLPPLCVGLTGRGCA